MRIPTIGRNAAGAAAQRTCWNRLFQRRRGAAMIEFALVCPFFFLFLYALLEFGRYVWTQQAVVNAAREGCRTAVLQGTTTGQTVLDAVRTGLQQRAGLSTTAANSATVTINNQAPGSVTFTNLTPAGTPVTVRVQLLFFNVSWAPHKWLAFLNAAVVQASVTMGRR